MSGQLQLLVTVRCCRSELLRYTLKLTSASQLQHVAGVALVVACLLNAPPSFLEFLLCIPWRHLGELYPR